MKGGFALDVRFGVAARSTKDLDLFSIHNRGDAFDAMFALAEPDAEDFFDFEVRLKKRISSEQPHNTASFHVSARLDGRRFEDVNVDMEISEILYFEADRIEANQFLGFAGIKPTEVALISLEQHLAEKVHAYARQFSGERENTRVKDLVDIVLISRLSRIKGAALIAAIDATFDPRGSLVPACLAPPPSSWSSGYRAMATQVNLDPELPRGFEVAQSFLDPVLARSTERQVWANTTRAWVELQSDQMAPLG